MTALWGGRRVPFTLIGGYLGAGKTTLVNHVVRNAAGSRLVVLVNDIGAVNVDAALIAAHDGRTMTLTNGCVCCSIADDLGPVLEEIRQMPSPPDHVVMELSGVAEPARMTGWASTAGFRLDGIVVVVDAEQVGSQLARADVGDTVLAQLAAADVVLVTKTDLVEDAGAGARSIVREHSTAPLVTAIDGKVDPTIVLGVGRLQPVPEPGSDPGADPVTHDYLVDALDVSGVSRAGLDEVLARLPATTVRAKGVVWCSDADHPVEVNAVGMRRRVIDRPDLDRADDVIVVIDR